MYSAQGSRVVTGGAIGSISLNQDAVGTKPSSVIPKRSTSDDVEECRAGTSEMFRTYASARVLSIAIRTSTIAQVPDSSGAQAGSTPAGRAARAVGAQAESVDAAEHRMKIPNAMGEWSAGNQEERSAVWFVVAILLPVDVDGDSHAHRRWPFLHDQRLKFPLADGVHNGAVE